MRPTIGKITFLIMLFIAAPPTLPSKLALAEVSNHGINPHAADGSGKILALAVKIANAKKKDKEVSRYKSLARQRKTRAVRLPFSR